MADNRTLVASGAGLSAGDVIALRSVSYSGDANALIAPSSLLTLSGADDAKTATDVSAANPLPVVSTPFTSGGCSTYHVVSGASTNAANIKASAGQVYSVDIFNNAEYPVYVKFHNTAGTPTAGSGVVRTIGVQAGTWAHSSYPNGLAFGTGIGISIVKDITAAGTMAVALSDCAVNVDYK